MHVCWKGINMKALCLVLNFAMNLNYSKKIRSIKKLNNLSLEI